MKTALLWNTYGGDAEWFKYSARSFTKFASGWDYAKCIVPSRDAALFEPTCKEHNIFLATYDEWPGKGFNHHQFLQCCGDQHFPADAEVIFHIDADCVFGAPCTPADWIHDGKILLPFRDFAEFLKTPLERDEIQTFMGFTGKTIDFNRGCYMWKFAADLALGWSVIRETMQWMPIIHHRDVYLQTRRLVESHQRTSFELYIKSCRNSFPQTFCEFNTLGAVAHRFFENRYRWWDLKSHGYPFWGKVIQSHSHGGFHKPHDFQFGLGVHTPLELFTKLGLT